MTGWPDSEALVVVGYVGYRTFTRLTVLDGAQSQSGGRRLRTGGVVMESLIRHQNIVHYRHLLTAVTDETVRQTILKLLAEEEQKQQDHDVCDYQNYAEECLRWADEADNEQTPRIVSRYGESLDPGGPDIERRNGSEGKRRV